MCLCYLGISINQVAIEGIFFFQVFYAEDIPTPYDLDFGHFDSA